MPTELPEKTWMDCGSKIYDHNPVQVGMYAAIIAWWFEFFPPENVLVLESKKIEEVSHVDELFLR